MYILGLSAYYHDSSAAILKDGELIAAIQEERISRIKHDKSLPVNAVEACLNKANISIREVDKVVYYEKPFWKFERILDDITEHVPSTFGLFARAMPIWTKKRLWTGYEIKRRLRYKGEVLYTAHHDAHAAVAFYTSGFQNAAFITVDGVGEYTTTSVGIASETGIKVLMEQQYPHSLGFLYSAFTQYCGFKVNSGEYKLMGLAPYGEPKYKELIYRHFIKVYPDASFHLNTKYFPLGEGKRMINREFEKLWPKPARKENETTEGFYADVAASIQQVLEEVMLQMVKLVKEKTGMDKLVLCGGVALNCKMNQRLVESGIFDQYYFYHNPGDAGSAYGAALQVWHEHLKKGTASNANNIVYAGTEWSNGQVKEVLEKNKVPHTFQNQVLPWVAGELKEGKIVGWFNGAMEFGPRALGNRSILADPRNAQMKDILNEKIKLRENFRPFAPALLSHVVDKYFETGNANYGTMMVTAKAKEPARSTMPAVVHEDGTSRIQLVDENDNPVFFELIESFYNLTQCPALINTSFNVRGEPIVESIEDALQTFLYTDMDLLVINARFVISKKDDLTQAMKRIKPRKHAAD